MSFLAIFLKATLDKRQNQFAIVGAISDQMYSIFVLLVLPDFYLLFFFVFSTFCRWIHFINLTLL